MYVSHGERVFLVGKLVFEHSFQIAHDLLSNIVKVI